MRINEQERKEAVEEIYLILAEFYKFPDEDFYEEVADGSLENRLKELYHIAGYHDPNFTLSNRFSSLAEMKKNYMYCFLGGSALYAPPVESLYKIWTTDPSVDMAMANQKGYLFGDAALHMNHLFKHYQIEVPKDYENMPDHLTLLLEFLAFILKNETDTVIRQYLFDHFDWLGDFKTELSKVENSSFYQDVTEIVIQAVDDERKWLEQKDFIS